MMTSSSESSSTLPFIPRAALGEFEWNPETRAWRRPPLDRELLRQLSERSTLNGLARVGAFVALLLATAVLTVRTAAYSPWLAIIPLYAYYFLTGFWVAIAHELQHKMVFAPAADRFSEILFFLVQVAIWNSPRYARISHRLHHRYTMVRGQDPETDWPEVITSRWLRRYLLRLTLNILFIGALRELALAVWTQMRRAAGARDRMMRDHCAPEDIRAIRIESATILLIHLVIAASALVFRTWWPILLGTMAWHVGASIEALWHQTEHIGRLYNVNDMRLCTRSIRVGPFIRFIYWGLDDHVDHHLFPAVPSRNLPKLHAVLKHDLPEPKTMIGCWREMFAIAREKDRRPDHEYVPIPLPRPDPPLETGPLRGLSRPR